MRLVMFCHSLRSDWNHGNVHFLRGVCTELIRRGHEVRVLEPRDGWSAAALERAEGALALDAYRIHYPQLAPAVYDPADFDLDRALDGADAVLVHEWNAPELVSAIGRRRARGARFRLLFHDTHHRSLSREPEIAALDLSGYDGVLAFGAVIRDRYERRGWARHAWTWHEAADPTVFHPKPIGGGRAPGGIVWIGNWGDNERSAEIDAYLLAPARLLRATGRLYGVGYPAAARAAIARSGLAFGGRLPNHGVPDAFALYAVTVHIPRRPYVSALPGVPTIRVFEALACGIPLVSAPWLDSEGLFAPGKDFLMATSPVDMRRKLRDVLEDRACAQALAEHGRRTVLSRHTCAHRVDELMTIVERLGVDPNRTRVA